MLDLKTVDELFGQPLSLIPKPQVPYKLKNWHVLAGIVLTGLALYGGYTLYQDTINKFKVKEPNEKNK